ncbi:MAG: hypothetical protein GY940_27305, partial [bacterium]|nr:hypothetical protein [bacterium]
SKVSTIHDQMMKLYNGGAHVISFFKWKDKTEATSVYRYKGNNRESGTKQFFNTIRDKARKPITTVFTPKKVESLTGSYNSTTGLVGLNWSSKIWTDLKHTWADWGDFKEFAIYRATTENFTPSSSTLIKKQTGYTFLDSGFPLGTTVYYKVAAVNSNGVLGPTQTVSTVTPSEVPIPIMNVTRDRLNFGYVQGGGMPPSQGYRIANNGGGSLSWTAVDAAQWLSCSPDSGTGNTGVAVFVDPSGLAVGSYTTSITVADPHATNSPQIIDIYLTVKSSSQNQDPFGSFSTPLDGSTAKSSIPVTGWVLDDVGIESVKIYRDPVANGGKNLIYIGDAGFVEGARPDIEASFPDYPANYRAGWGYMMLTNFL